MIPLAQECYYLPDLKRPCVITIWSEGVSLLSTFSFMKDNIIVAIFTKNGFRYNLPFFKVEPQLMEEAYSVDNLLLWSENGKDEKEEEKIDLVSSFQIPLLLTE